MKRTLFCLALSTTLATGCSPTTSEVDAAFGTTREALVVSNGEVLNGRDLNGRDLNGRDLNGRDLNGRDLNGRDLNGRDLNGRDLNGRDLNGRDLNGRDLNGRDLNGRDLNGRDLNGRDLNGRDLNGRDLNGRELNAYEVDLDRAGARLNGVAATRLRLEGSELVAELEDGRVARGEALAGLELQSGPAYDAVPLRLAAVRADGDVWHYDVRLAGTRWQGALCGTADDGTPLTALALAGAWDYRQGVPGGGARLSAPGVLTFACDGGALAKCVRFGYAPWRLVPSCTREGCGFVSLADHHQACTRMVRADYCGDGRSFTRDGTLINLYDQVGVQQDTEAWAFEAEWEPAGARCLSSRRITATTTVPHCERELALDDCGAPAHFSTGTLLMTEDAPRRE